ncbi:MAG: hypothetical protein GKR87_11810 [Kiritimatiellae bacterium]|nr:hypothetical protein [Kiritimatiellia bacterium]
MRDISLVKVRNFVLLGHTGSGKTSLLDAIIYKQESSDRHGSPEDGTSALDYTDEEKAHKISIWAKPYETIYKTRAGNNINIVAIDTPGYVDFFGQVIAASTVSDSAIIVVDAQSGIQVGSNRAWRQCVKRGLPRAVVITGLDKDNVDFDAALSAIQGVWGQACVPVVIPASDGSCVIDVLSTKDVPEDLVEKVNEIKGRLIEYAAETDDGLIEKYLGGEDLSAEEVAVGLHGAVHSGNLIPVFVTSSKTSMGIDELLEGISLLLPSPLDIEVKDADDRVVDPNPERPFSGFVWRSINDPYMGQLTFLRVLSGTLRADSEIFNSTKERKERVGHLYIVNGKEQKEISEAEAGDIVAIPKLKHTALNDSLCEVGQNLWFPPIEFPQPVTTYAVEPKTQGGEDKMAAALHRIADEDSTITVHRNAETHELILSGMGDVQLDIAVEKMKKRSHVDVVLHTPKSLIKKRLPLKVKGTISTRNSRVDEANMAEFI